MNSKTIVAGLMHLFNYTEAVSIHESINFAQLGHNPSCEDIGFNKSQRVFAKLECSGTSIDLLDPQGVAGVDDWVIGIDDNFDASSCFPDEANITVKHLDCDRFSNIGDWCRDGDFASIDGTKLVLDPPLDARSGGWYPLLLNVQIGLYHKNNVLFVRIPETDFDFCKFEREIPGADFEDFEGLAESLRNKIAAHQASELIFDTAAAFGNLEREAVREDLTRPDNSAMGLFYCDPDEEGCTNPPPEDEPIDDGRVFPTEPEDISILPPPCFLVEDDESGEAFEDCLIPPPRPILPPPPRVVPLKEVLVEATIDSGCALATIDFQMTYVNPGDRPILTTYEFPLDEDTVLSALTIITADQTIVAEIQEKKEARENFDQIIEDGDVGVFVERREGDKFMSIKIGNLLPGEEITISAQMILTLQVVNEAWSFILPVAFYPNYSRFGFGDLGRYPYKFAYAITVESIEGITMLSAPGGAQVEYESTGRYATIFNDEPDRSIQVFFRSNDMLEPQLIAAQSSEFPNEIAGLISFTPNFDDGVEEAADSLVIVEDQEPEQTVVIDPSTLHFIFVLDRSGSMYGERIDNAKQALILFLRSLPFGCKFTVISYGSRQEFLAIRGVDGNIFEYNEENLKEAIRQIETFDADMGGTNIASPMDMAINEVSDPALTKRVILLTDGQITEGEPAERVIELAQAENAITHTIGLSRGADADLLERTAEAGRGSFSLIDDQESGRVLNSKVILALQRCLQPALEGCSIRIGDAEENLKTVFRNQVIQRSLILEENQAFEAEIIFQCDRDPTTGQPIRFSFDFDDFIMASDDKALNIFKVAASKQNKLSVEDAIKYQVLTDSTAFIGVVIQENTSEDLEELEPIRFGTGVIRLPEPEFPIFEEEFAFGGGFVAQPSFARPVLQPAIAISPVARNSNIIQNAIVQPAFSIPVAQPAFQPIPQSITFDVDDEEEEEEEEAFESAEAEDVTPEATLEALIDTQNSIFGFWKDEADDVLELFTSNDLIDQNVFNNLVNQDMEAYRTALALYILEEKFIDREDEWILIAQKGKDYLQDKSLNLNDIIKSFPAGFLA